MIDRSDTERLVRLWLEDGPSTMPDRVVINVADRIARQPRHRTPRLVWRPRMNTQVKLLAAVAAVLVIAFTGWSLLPRQGGVGAPLPSPSPTVAPTGTATPSAAATPTAAAISCDGGTTGCLGPLAAGTYTAANFRPRLAYTVPEGWSNSYDPGRGYTLVPPGAGFSFQVLSEVEIPEQTQPDCNAVKKAGVDGSVADWVAFLTKNPGLTAKPAVPVTVGGAAGFRVDFARSSSWTALCPNSAGPAVVVWVRTGVTKQGRWTDDQQESFWILDVGGATVLITLESSPNPSDHARDLLTAQPIIDSFRFNP